MLKGKVALVTGSGSGIGKAIALALAKEGANVAIADINETAANEVAQLLVKDFGCKTIAVKADVSKTEDVDNMVNEILNRLGTVDILVNNASIGQEFVPTIEQSIDKWDRVISTHLRGSYLCSRKVGQWMVNQKSGNILNIASIVGCGGFPMRTSYGPAKAGFINLTQALAVEWATYNIRVNCLAPSYVITPLIEKDQRWNIKYGCYQ